MHKQATPKTNAMEAALVSSLSLMATPTKVSAAWPRTPLTTIPTTPALQLSTRKFHGNRHLLTPDTPCAPQKRSRPLINRTSEPSTPKKRMRSPPTPNIRSLKQSRSHKKKLIAFDRVVCIPFPVLRSQKDDPSALLRPLPRRSDEVKKLVKIRIERELEKVRAGCNGILESAIASPKRRRVQ